MQWNLHAPGWRTKTLGMGLGMVLGLVLPTGPAAAHLALIRQGEESAEIPNADDAMGRAVAAGDFDGDGYEDLASAAPDESNQIINTPVQGAVVVNYGSAFGLVPEGADLLTVGAVTDDVVRYGWSLAAGDFDDDGYDDLAVGLPRLDELATVDVGAVWIHMGGPLGLPETASVILRQSDAGASNEADDLFGWSLHVADFDDDGFDDLVVGSIGEDGGAGLVAWFYGSAAGITTTGAGWMKQSSLGYTNDPDDWFGYALTSGDFDSNGERDLAIGTPNKDVTASGLLDMGRVYVAFGTGLGISPAFVEYYDPQTLGENPLPDSRFGWALAAGRFWDADMVVDLAVGEPQYDQSGQNAAGRVLVLEFVPLPTKSGWLTDATVPASTTARDGGSEEIVQAIATDVDLPPASVNVLRQGVNGVDFAEANDNFGFALAAGRFDPDDLDDLAVGVPYENIDLGDMQGSPLDAGMAHVYSGDPSGPGWWEEQRFTCATQNDATSQLDVFGQALCFGRFDDSGRDNLAVGAPGKDFIEYDGDPTVFDAGAVYVVAPWRQPTSRPHRSSLAYDCAKNIVYSQRMYQRLRPASTTKTVTLLLACEAIQAQVVDPDYMYTVPTWVAANIGGSQMDLIAGEQISFSDLMKGMMTVSGNDAAYALADIMMGDGNPWGGSYGATLPGFQALMNNEMAQHGAINTTMTNPPGLDVGDHYTTALDFANLAWDAMTNDCVREIVGTSPWVLTRILPGYLQNWLMPQPVQTVFPNGFVDGIKLQVASATGIKGGSTPGAQKTGLWSAGALGGEAIVSAFGVRREDVPVEGSSGDCLTCTGAELLQVAMGECEPGLALPPVPPDEPDLPYGVVQGLPTGQGNGEGLVFQTGGCREDILVELFRTTYVKPQVQVNLAVIRSSSIQLGRSESVAIGLPDGYDGALDIRLYNPGPDVAELNVDVAGVVSVITLPADASTTVPAPSVEAAKLHFEIVLSNIGATAVYLQVDELGYLFAALLTDARGGDQWSLTLPCVGPQVDQQSLTVYFAGKDTDDSDLVDASVHGQNKTTGVEDPGDPPPARTPSGYVLHPPSPNPFNPSTTIRYEVPRPGPVTLRIYDLAGRLVRTLESGAVASAGTYQTRWNGQDDHARPVSSGVYLLRMDAPGFVGRQRLTLIK